MQQFKEYNCRVPNLLFHRLLMQDFLPLKIGGSINLGALSMLLLKKAHIGEVLPYVFDDKVIYECEKRGISLL